MKLYGCSHGVRISARPGPGTGRAEVLGSGPPKVVEFVVLTVKLTFLHEIYSNSLFYWLKTPFPSNLIVFTDKKYEGAVPPLYLVWPELSRFKQQLRCVPAKLALGIVYVT